MTSTNTSSPFCFVMIHWKIKPEFEQHFLSLWTQKFDIKNREHLIGEYLSKPTSASECPGLLKNFPGRPKEDKPYISYLNVGIWDSFDAFNEETGAYQNQSSDKAIYEQYHRERFLWNPFVWRNGKKDLPKYDNLAY